MEVLNKINYKRYSLISDFLAFLGIYDDKVREEKWKGLMLKNRDYIKNSIVVELGAGFGIFSEFALELGAKKVYAIERNPYLFNVLKERVKKYSQIKALKIDALKFLPKESIDVVIHDFYGNLLYDESLHVLDNLKFNPSLVIPNAGKLKLGFLDLYDFDEEVVDYVILKQLKNVLVSELFLLDQKPNLHDEVEIARWKFNEGLLMSNIIDISKFKGDILLFYIEIFHDDEFVCSSFDCKNWSIVYSFRASNKFFIKFKWNGEFTDVIFKYV